MQPVICHDRRMERATRLRDLVLMVREDEIDAAAVDVEHLAKMLPAHGRALDMPAGSAGTRNPGGRGPCGLSSLRGLPQHEIHRVALVRSDLDARACDHLIEGATR